MSAPVFAPPEFRPSGRIGSATPVELARHSPAMASTIETAYTVSEGEAAQVTSIIVCNTSAGGVTVRVFHSTGTATAAQTDAIMWDVAVTNTAPVTQNLLINLDEGDTLQVFSTDTDTNFFFYGTELRR